MAGSRDPLRDLPEAPPPRDLSVAPARVAPHGSGRRAGVVGAAVVGLIAMAIGLAGLEPPAAPDRPAPPASPALAADGPATPVPSAEPTPAPSRRTATPGVARVTGVPPRLSPAALRDGVLDGSLEGRLVFVDGELRVSPARCQSLAQAAGGCVDLAIAGIGLPVWAGADAIPWRADPPPGAWLVTVARAGGLVYLGALVPDPAVPGSVNDLASRYRRGDVRAAAATLYEVPGWLVPAAIRPCGRPGSLATPCPVPAPFLAADAPDADGRLQSSRGGAVALSSPVVDLERGRPVTAGTFLVVPPARCEPGGGAAGCARGARWTVVARYEPARSVRVLAP